MLYQLSYRGPLRPEDYRPPAAARQTCAGQRKEGLPAEKAPAASVDERRRRGGPAPPGAPRRGDAVPVRTLLRRLASSRRHPLGDADGGRHRQRRHRLGGRRRRTRVAPGAGLGDRRGGRRRHVAGPEQAARLRQPDPGPHPRDRGGVRPAQGHSAGRAPRSRQHSDARDTALPVRRRPVLPPSTCCGPACSCETARPSQCRRDSARLPRGTPQAGQGLAGAYSTKSRRLRASRYARSLASVLASIWRMRSRVTPNCTPTSSSVCGRPSVRP